MVTYHGIILNACTKFIQIYSLLTANSQFLLHCLVVSTHLKHISQIGSFPQIGVNIKYI